VVQFAATKAGFCFVPSGTKVRATDSRLLIPSPSVPHAFAAAARLFYPDSGLAVWRQQQRIDPTARIGKEVLLAPGAVIGAGAEIGDGSRIGPNAVIGRGVAIGRNCEIEAIRPSATLLSAMAF